MTKSAFFLGHIYDLNWPIGACIAFCAMALIEMIISVISAKPRGKSFKDTLKKSIYEKAMHLGVILSVGVVEFAVGLLLVNMSPWFSEARTFPFIIMPLTAMWYIIRSLAATLVYAEAGGVKIPKSLLKLATKITCWVEKQLKK